MTKSQDRIATAADWEIHPMPARCSTFALDLSYAEAEIARIRHGFIPHAMEEKWFLYFSDGCLHMHRSWTGNYLFQVFFTRVGTHWYATHAIANREPEEYDQADDAVDQAMIADIIQGYLVTDDYHHKHDGFLAGLGHAMQPNYLGSPDVVRDALTPLFAAKVGWWVHLRDKSAPKVTLQEVDDIELQIANIFAGQHPDYTAMPWHSIEQLGQSAISCFNLNAEYCADESLFFVMFESVATIALAIHKMLDSYILDTFARWPDVIQQLHEMQKFAESVLLGTAVVAYPGKTLQDFQWQPVIVEDEEELEEEHPIDPHTHPCDNDKGQTVHIKHPHSPTSRESWHDENAIATFVPAGECPDEINGIALAPWDDHPEGDDWDDVDGQLEDLEEPVMQLKVGLKPASGCVIEEPDGRVWVVSPTNRFGNYKNTFPKGKIEDEMSWQANAIKESYEESGLQVRIIGLIGDVNRTTTVTRYYRAVRVGGMPVDMGWESQAVHLVPRIQLPKFLDSHYDHRVIEAL